MADINVSRERKARPGREEGAARSPEEITADPEYARLATLSLVAAGVVVAVVVAALVLWHARAVVLLLFLAYTLAAAVRPSVERLVRLRVPHWLAVGVHLLLAAALAALLLWLVVPTALRQTEAALDDVPAAGARADEGTVASLKRRFLGSVERELRTLPSPGEALSAAADTLAVLAGIAFTLACAVYWLSERDRVVRLVLGLAPPAKRDTIQDAWLLIELKLGAVIRVKLLLVVMVSAILTTAFWLIGVPYFLLLGTFAGIVEIIPVIGPLIAGLTAVAAGLTVSWETALAAAIAVYGLRIVQDYVINPRLFGRAVHLPPLVVLLAVSAIALLLGPFWVPLAIPITAVLSTLVDVIVRQTDPAAEPVPTVLIRTDDTVADRRRLGWLRERRAGGGRA